MRLTTMLRAVASAVSGGGSGGAGTRTTLSPADKSVNATLTNGNLTYENTTNSYAHTRLGNARLISGKYYVEYTIQTLGNSADLYFGLKRLSDVLDSTSAQSGKHVSYRSDGTGQPTASAGITVTSTGAQSVTVGDVLMMAVDLDNAKVWFGKNGTWMNSGNPAAGTNPQATGLDAIYWGVCVMSDNQTGTSKATINIGPTYTYSVPTGFTGVIGQGAPAFNGDKKATGITLSNSDRTMAISTDLNFLKVYCDFSFDKSNGGKYYWEVTIDTAPSVKIVVGMTSRNNATNQRYDFDADAIYWASNNTSYNHRDWTAPGTTLTYTAGDVLMFALDATNGKLWIGKNGTWIGSGDPAAGTNATSTWTSTTGGRQEIVVGRANAGSATAQQCTINTGQAAFTYTKPTGFSSLLV